MTSKKKLRKKINYWKNVADNARDMHHMLMRRFLAGEEPTAVDRAIWTDIVTIPEWVKTMERTDTPVLNTLPKMTWGFSSTGDGVVGENDRPIADYRRTITTESNVHDGWLLTPRSEEKRSMKGGTE